MSHLVLLQLREPPRTWFDFLEKTGQAVFRRVGTSLLWTAVRRFNRGL